MCMCIYHLRNFCPIVLSFWRADKNGSCSGILHHRMSKLLLSCSTQIKTKQWTYENKDPKSYEMKQPQQDFELPSYRSSTIITHASFHGIHEHWTIWKEQNSKVILTWDGATVIRMFVFYVTFSTIELLLEVKQRELILSTVSNQIYHVWNMNSGTLRSWEGGKLGSER